MRGLRRFGLLLLVQREFKQTIRKRLVAIYDADDDKRERDDYYRKQYNEENGKTEHPFPRLCLFGIDVLLKRLENREVVHALRLAEDAYSSARSVAVVAGIDSHIYFLQLTNEILALLIRMRNNKN